MEKLTTTRFPSGAAFVFFTLRIETEVGTRTLVPAVAAFLLAGALFAWRNGAISVRPGSAALIGVLVSVTTMPAAANIAVSAAYSHWDNLWGSTLQLLVNLGALIVGGTGTLLVERWAYQRRAIRQAKKAGVAAV